ncbi:transposase [Paenibacillus sp. MER 180]|uniref:transposase n=1 Tax=Paenibacillus sp. MER 180 TaxID=2939570 RepID=UPI0037C7BE1E
MLEWKEVFTRYDCASSFAVGRLGFDRWCEQGTQIDHTAARNTLKTMCNWKEEIVNCHQCRWTYSPVEGRHNRIKPFSDDIIYAKL